MLSMNHRETILMTLKKNTGHWVSGESISETLNVSRTTVWKYIKALQSDGYAIESSSKKGYRLSGSPDLLSADEVIPGLNTLVFGRQHYYYHREIDSTNDEARRLASLGYPEGTVVVAEMQAAGKGRRGRTWFSPWGLGIYLSVILRPNIPLKEVARVSLVNAVAVAETLIDELGLAARIKWPNDILVNNRKIAGILSEAITDMDAVEFIVTGIGININNRREDFPADLRTPPTSVMAECTNASFSRTRILQSLLGKLENNYYAMLSNEFEYCLERSRKLSMILGREVQLDTINGTIKGTAIDINADGFLLVRDASGFVHTIMSGEISLLSPQPGNPYC